MATFTDTIAELKQKLTSATHVKLKAERETHTLRSTEITLTEEVRILNAEIEFYKEKLEETQKKIFQTRHQMTLIEICKVSEKTKFQANIQVLNKYKSNFDDLFLREKQLLEMQNEEQRRLDLKIEQEKQEKAMQLVKEKKEELQRVIAVEKDCDSLESECAILKKRNMAIMLKLRRKLVEMEDTRKRLMQSRTIE